jgi:hypothetical protein
MIAGWIARYAFAAAVALAAMAAWSATMVHRGVVKEKVRVERVGAKINARAKKARNAAEKTPDDALRRWCRDC